MARVIGIDFGWSNKQASCAYSQFAVTCSDVNKIEITVADPTIELELADLVKYTKAGSFSDAALVALVGATLPATKSFRRQWMLVRPGDQVNSADNPEILRKYSVFLYFRSPQVRLNVTFLGRTIGQYPHKSI